MDRWGDGGAIFSLVGGWLGWAAMQSAHLGGGFPTFKGLLWLKAAPGEEVGSHKEQPLTHELQWFLAE